MQGWLTLFAWLAASAGPSFIAGGELQGLLILDYPDHVPKGWHLTLLMWAIMVLPIVANVFARRVLKPIELSTCVLRLVGWPATIATILACARTRNTDDFVWGTFSGGLTGWSSNGVIFSIGLLTPAFALSGFDGMLHLSEEVMNPKQVVPRAMVWGVAINDVLAFGYLLPILYSIGNLQDAIESSTVSSISVPPPP